MPSHYFLASGPAPPPRGTRVPITSPDSVGIPVSAPIPQPPPAPPPPVMPSLRPWYSAAIPGVETIVPGTSAREYMQQLITNAAIPYFTESRTAAETAKWLARANPYGYAQYANVQLPGVNPVGYESYPQGTPLAMQSVGNVKLPTQQSLAAFGATLDFDKLIANLPTDVTKKLWGETGKATDTQKQAVADARAGVQWLRQMLETTAPALQRGQTRAQRALALGHATTLMKEAEKEPGVGGLYTSLAENLVNPIMQRPTFAGTPFGSMRTLSTPAGTFRRGGTTLRNVALT